DPEEVLQRLLAGGSRCEGVLRRRAGDVGEMRRVEHRPAAEVLVRASETDHAEDLLVRDHLPRDGRRNLRVQLAVAQEGEVQLHAMEALRYARHRLAGI